MKNGHASTGAHSPDPDLPTPGLEISRRHHLPLQRSRPCGVAQEFS